MSKEYVSVIGGGPAGAYLAYLLEKEQDVDVTVWDMHITDTIGEHCAWGTNTERLLSMFDGDKRMKWKIKELILSKRDTACLDVDGQVSTYKTKNLATIDKPELLKSMLSNVWVKPKKFTEKKMKNDRLYIDATGWRRTLLGTLLGGESNGRIPCYQTLCEGKSGDISNFYAKFGDGVGYLWEFPLDSRNYTRFVGAGYLNRNPRPVVEDYIEEKGYTKLGQEGGVIRIIPPHHTNICRMSYSARRDTSMVIGVGETVGSTHPLSGEGIVSAMKSAKILFELLKERDFRLQRRPLPFSEICTSYRKKLIEEFNNHLYEYRLLQSLSEGKKLTAFYNALRIGERPNVKLSFTQKLKIITSLLRSIR